RAREEPRDAAVVRTDLAEIIRTDETAGTALVLNQNGWLAINVLADMSREQPSLDVTRATRREVDQDRQALAFVEWIGRKRRRCHQGEQQAADQGWHAASHRILLLRHSTYRRSACMHRVTRPEGADRALEAG